MSGPSSPRSGRRLHELDLLRFIAAAAVTLHHFAGVPTAAWGRDGRQVFPELAEVAQFGYLGVQLFFVISGFVILMTAWGRAPGDFAASRVVRLFPAYWFGVVLALGVYLATGHGVDYGPGSEGPVQRFLPNLTMLQEGVGSPHMEVVYWTLWIELHFYALIAVLAWRGIDYRRCVGFMVVWLLAGAFASEADVKLLKLLLFPGFAPYFIAGMAFFLIYRFGPNLVLWLITALCWALACYYGVRDIHPTNAWPGVHEYAVPAVITAIFVVIALVAVHRLSWIRWRGFMVMGALTYPLYLLHETISRALIRTLYPEHDRWTVFAAATAAVLVAAYLVHRLVEVPAQRWMRPRLNAALQQIRAGGPPDPPVPPPRPEPEPVPAARPLDA